MLWSPFGDCTNSSCERTQKERRGLPWDPHLVATDLPALAKRSREENGPKGTRGPPGRPTQDASGVAHLTPLSSPPSAPKYDFVETGEPAGRHSRHPRDQGHAPLDRFSGPVSFGARFVNLDVCRF